MINKSKVDEVIKALENISGEEALDLIFDDLNDVIENLEAEEFDKEDVQEVQKFYKLYYKILKNSIKMELDILKTFNDECFVLYYDEKDKEYKSMVNFDFKNLKHRLVYAYLCKDKIEDVDKINN